MANKTKKKRKKNRVGHDLSHLENLLIRVFDAEVGYYMVYVGEIM